MINQIVVSFYFILFIAHCFKHHQLQWLWGSVILGLGFGFIGQFILPGIIGMVSFNNWYIVYFYITIASLFHFVNHWKFDKTGKEWINEPATGWYLSTLSISGLIMSIAYGILFCMFYFPYPYGSSQFLLLSHLQLYFLQPSFWIVSQWVLMLCIRLSCTWGDNKKVAGLNLTHLQLVFLSALLIQLAYIAWDVKNFMSIWG